MAATASARWKDLCIDAVDTETSLMFWSRALGLDVARRSDHVWLTGPTSQHTAWINAVPEPTTVKNRAHVDVHAASVAELEAWGATVVQPFPRWTVMRDPDGQEFCAFVRDDVPAYRLYELVVDTGDAAALARWWAAAFGVEARAEPWPDGTTDWWVVPPGAPFDGIVFGDVPEPKTVKNRVHWDVTGSTADLVAAGATLVRARDDDIGWDVLADPEGNEFCVFT